MPKGRNGRVKLAVAVVGTGLAAGFWAQLEGGKNDAAAEALQARLAQQGAQVAVGGLAAGECTIVGLPVFILDGRQQTVAGRANTIGGVGLGRTEGGDTIRAKVRDIDTSGGDAARIAIGGGEGDPGTITTEICRVLGHQEGLTLTFTLGAGATADQVVMVQSAPAAS